MTAHVLTLPGWQGSGPQHWQSRWEALYRYRRVEQSDWLWPRRGDWMARLDEVVLERSACACECASAAVLVAHSLGCHLVAAWAARSAHVDRVQAALLAAPPDTERADMPPNLYSWRPMVRKRLPFRSVVVASRDDPYCEPARSAALAADWGSDLIEIGAHGHINGDSGLGDWPEGHALLAALLAD